MIMGSSFLWCSLNDWLGIIGDRLPDKPLFCTVDRATFGHRLSGNAIYNTCGRIERNLV
jgi:hypothetical protein